MKQIALAVMIIFAASACFAADTKKKEEEKYEVTITIVYNEVPSSEAIEIAKRAHEQFKSTCKHEVKIKKVDPINAVISISSGTYNYVTPTNK